MMELSSSKDLPPLLTEQPSTPATSLQSDSTMARRRDGAIEHSVDVDVSAPADEVEDGEEWEVDGMIPCCGLGVLACFQNCSFPSCLGCHVAGQACCCDLQYVRLS